MSRNWRVVLTATATALLLASTVWAQGRPVGRISGQVSAVDGEGLPGVTVTFESPALQGQQVVVTEEGGYYTSPPLPPGEYTVQFDLDGYQPVAQRVRASAAAQATVDVELERTEFAEEIVVSGQAVETISEGSSASTTLTSEIIDELPTGRDLNDFIQLTPGVQNSGSTVGIGGMSISGAQTWDNLFTLNGVVLNENLRGQPFDLYIEDAIQEATTTIGGVSAEHGRFTGGVVTAVTKSGGNEFSGSFRTTFENDDWKSSNDLSPERVDQVNETFEATLGGRIVQDHLWFFGAGRNLETSETDTTVELNLPFQQDDEQDRFEAKLTGSITPSHQVQATYTEIDTLQTNIAHGAAVNPIVLDDSFDPERTLPQELQVLSYTGVLSNNFFLDAQYAERQFSFVGGGGEDVSFAGGTPIWDLALGTQPAYNASVFCGVCPQEDRDNEQARVKANWFLSTADTGSHDLVFGAETYTDIRKADNHQSATDWFAWNFVPSITTDTEVFPVFLGEQAPTSMFLMFLPILNPSQGTDFQTDSAFVHDSWRVNDSWTLDLGVRYDTTDAVNSNGATVADSDEISPRLGVTWTPQGGASPWNFHAYAGRYVGLAANGVFDNSSPAGNPASFYFVYGGDPINAGGGPLVSPEAAMGQVFDWLFDLCPGLATNQDPERPFDPPNSLEPVINCPAFIGADIPGFNTLVEDSLAPNSADELKLGFSRRLGDGGSIRADVIYREWQNFFVTQRDLTTGTITEPDTGLVGDLGFIVNEDDAVTREYLGLDVVFNYALLDRRLRLGGALTLSELEGNAIGETSGSGPVSSGVLEYPEYVEPRWNSPEGRLAFDRPVKLDAWATYELLRTQRNRLSVSLLQSFDAGTPYGAFTDIDPTPFVDNPGYASLAGTTERDYFFTARDAFDTDDVTRTDLSFNYGFTVGQWQFFVQPQVVNVFNEDAVIDPDDTTLTAADDDSLQPFNPFTETPIEGVHWRKGDNFGQPLNEADLQDPREFRISAGIRFNW